MLKEVKLEYTVNTLVKLAKDKWGDNAPEYLAGALESVITTKQMKVLINHLQSEIN